MKGENPAYSLFRSCPRSIVTKLSKGFQAANKVATWHGSILVRFLFVSFSEKDSSSWKEIRKNAQVSL